MAAAFPIPQIAGYRFDVAADLSDASTRQRLSAAGVKAFLRIAERWRLRDQDARALLGGISSGSFYTLKSHAAPRPGPGCPYPHLTAHRHLQGSEHSLQPAPGRRLYDAAQQQSHVYGRDAAALRAAAGCAGHGGSAAAARRAARGAMKPPLHEASFSATHRLIPSKHSQQGTVLGELAGLPTTKSGAGGTGTARPMRGCSVQRVCCPESACMS